MLKKSLSTVKETSNSSSYVSSCSEEETSSQDADSTSGPILSTPVKSQTKEINLNCSLDTSKVNWGNTNEKESQNNNTIPPSIPEVISQEVDEHHTLSPAQSTARSSIGSSSKDRLQSQISSLEEQIQSLTAAIRTMQNQQTQPKAPLSPSTSIAESLGLSQQGNEPLLDSESPPPANKEDSKILSLIAPDDMQEIMAPPDLEYRSFTPNYEEELRKIRKTSRGMSIDQSETSTILSVSNISTHNSSHNNLNQDALMNDGDSRNNSDKENGIGEVGKVAAEKPPRKEVSITNTVQNDILAEANIVDSAKSKGKPFSSNHDSNASVTTSSPQKPPRTGGVADAKLEESKTLSHVEEKMNTNAVVEFIRGLNIDSRQQDGSATDDVDANMEEFLRVPFRIEKLLLFGVAVCFDCFLNVLTVTPLKFIWSCLCLLSTLVRPGKGFGFCRFHRRHFYQLLRVLVIYFVYKFVLCPISLGRLYHWIRGQAMLKLYVLMAMVEVFDRLMCSFGQDALDSLYWNTTKRPYHPRMIASIIVVLAYATIHSYILFVHAATLNVAMNSEDSALMSLLIGGNFAEIKSTVFKKYNKQNLFKITTSDICERFKLVLFLGLVLLLNCTQGGMNQEMVNDYINMSFVILGAEMACDWIKHSFITKFNFIKSSVYNDYSLVLSGDITGIGHEALHIEHTHSVVKRLGFAQIPLVCVTLRYLKEAARYADILTKDGDSNHVLYSLAVIWTNSSWRIVGSYLLTCFLFLLGIKFVLGYVISRQARSIILYGPIEGSVVQSETKRRQVV